MPIRLKPPEIGPLRRTLLTEKSGNERVRGSSQWRVVDKDESSSWDRDWTPRWQSLRLRGSYRNPGIYLMTSEPYTDVSLRWHDKLVHHFTDSRRTWKNTRTQIFFGTSNCPLYKLMSPLFVCIYSLLSENLGKTSPKWKRFRVSRVHETELRHFYLVTVEDRFCSETHGQTRGKESLMLLCVLGFLCFPNVLQVPAPQSSIPRRHLQ